MPYISYHVIRYDPYIHICIYSYDFTQMIMTDKYCAMCWVLLVSSVYDNDLGTDGDIVYYNFCNL